MKYLFILILILPLSLMAKPIVMSSDELSLAESLARLQSIGGTPYANHLLTKLRRKAKAENIFAKAAELRKYELAHDNESIYELCTKAFEARHNADWSHDDRAFFIRCFKHLQLLSSDPRKKMALEVEISAFSANATNKNSSIQITIRDINIWILINGRAYAVSENNISIPDTSFRMTLISNQYKRITKVLTKEEFARFKPKYESLVSGSCNSGFRYESKELNSYELKNALVASKHCKKALLSHPIESKFTLKKHKFKIPNWAWWMAGGILSYAVYENNRDSSDRPTKTSKRGF